MRNRPRGDKAVHDLPSDTTFTGPLPSHGHERLSGLVHILAHALCQGEAVSARKARGSAGGGVLATVATAIAVAVIGVAVRTEAGVAIAIRISSTARGLNCVCSIAPYAYKTWPIMRPHACQTVTTPRPR